MRRSRPLVAALAALTLVLAGCGDGEGSEDKRESLVHDVPKEDVSGDPETWPLTGLPVQGNSVRRHPVLVLKMDNTSSSAPQRGLSKADLVVEELVEGGMTRLAAFYYSQLPADAGPVRSMRASDIGIVAPVDGTMVTSGAAAITLKRIAGAGIPHVTEGSAGFYRDSARSMPYDLLTDMKAVAKAESAKPHRPADYLPWGKASDLPPGQPARSLTAHFSGSHATSWSYRDGGYVNDNSYAAEGDEFPADTVLVLRVQVGDAGYKDPAGNPVPETRLAGSGEALLFHGGRLVRGTWRKKSLQAPITLAARGKELRVPAGRTWVELVPASGGDVSFE